MTLDELARVLTDAVTEQATLKARTEAAEARVAGAEAFGTAQLERADALQIDLVNARADLDNATADIKRLEARIAELEKPTPDPDPEPDPEPEPEPVRKTMFGSCPAHPGGESLSAARTVTAKWGERAAVRQFKGNLTAPNQVGSITHTSYKPSITDLLAGRLDAQIAAAVNGARPGDVLEVWHEADKKVTDGVDTYDRLVAAKSYFYDKVKALRSDVLVCNTVTGWLFEPTRTGVDWRRWGAVKADIIGIDCDGIHPTKLPYTNYEGETKRAREFVAEFADQGYRFYAVPEYGFSRISTDTNGAERAKTYKQYGSMWAADPLCLYVTLYEYDPSSAYTYRLTTQAEIDAWKSLI